MEISKGTKKAAVELLRSLGMVADRNTMCREYMDLMRFTAMDAEAPFFSEGYLYDLLGKDDARSVMAFLSTFVEAAGIPRDEQHELSCLADRTCSCEFCWGDGYRNDDEPGTPCDVCKGKGYYEFPIKLDQQS